MFTAHREKNHFGYISKNSVFSLYTDNIVCSKPKKQSTVCERVFKAYDKEALKA
jgi:hypothetical protein